MIVILSAKKLSYHIPKKYIPKNTSNLKRIMGISLLPMSLHYKHK